MLARTHHYYHWKWHNYFVAMESLLYDVSPGYFSYFTAILIECSLEFDPEGSSSRAIETPIQAFTLIIGATHFTAVPIIGLWERPMYSALKVPVTDNLEFTSPM